ncbi:DegT/DnrJ/EryC1/StrS family aminotransferase [Pendulispora albinea]|uniref:DegT/DnrJ/EryC1/StrS family aminotransferase n=1 Tax=Pendulispora albinea TaxID=2741071 RepID=A0ABZ2LWP7_9BACT
MSEGRAMDRLAMLGGARAVPRGTAMPEWPVVTAADREAVNRVLDSGKFTAMASGEREIAGLEEAWAKRVGVRHCAAVANGTIAIQIALAAVGIGPGDEVVVPALSFVATGLAPVHLQATPVFADIDPATYNLSPAAFEAAITPRTRAVVPVHLHGLPAEMDAIREVAERHGIAVIEDAAQAHGVVYRGRHVGSLGSAATFSLNVSKNLPTCGEGGLVTTDDTALYERIAAMRQFGETLAKDGTRDYISRIMGWNAKINAIQAAFTRSQLERFDTEQMQRDQHVRTFLTRLAPLPGLVVPRALPDRGHAWHILRLRCDATALGRTPSSSGPLRAIVCRALRAEGVPVSRYQSMPLSEQPVFQGCPAGELPVTRAVIEDSFTLQKAHLNPAAGPVLERYADAFEKVWRHMDLLIRMAEGGAR